MDASNTIGALSDARQARPANAAVTSPHSIVCRNRQTQYTA